MSGEPDNFGYACALDDDGNVLVVAAGGEDSNATGIEGNQADNFETGSGAVYVFTLNALDQWSQTTYVKASNTDGGDAFGWSIATDGTGSTVAVGSFNESSSSTGVGGSQISDSMTGAGAVYLF